MEDKKIICKDCGKEFIFTVGEQEFYKEKGFENDPVRCPDCRRARKAQKINREKRQFFLSKRGGFQGCNVLKNYRFFYLLPYSTQKESECCKQVEDLRQLIDNSEWSRNIPLSYFFRIRDQAFGGEELID